MHFVLLPVCVLKVVGLGRSSRPLECSVTLDPQAFICQALDHSTEALFPTRCSPLPAGGWRMAPAGDLLRVACGLAGQDA